MPVQKVSILALLSIAVFFIVHVFYTQKIYRSNSRRFLIFSILFPVILILFSLDLNKDGLFKTIPFSCICFVYFILLRLLKVNYKALNNFFVQKNWVNKKYSDKVFTFVHFGDVGIDDYWDEKTATPPSWLDKFITFSLFIIPILFVWLITIILTTLFWLVYLSSNCTKLHSQSSIELLPYKSATQRWIIVVQKLGSKKYRFTTND